MRKKIRKLALTKETLRGLEDPTLENVAGGTIGQDTCPVLACGSNATRACSVCCGP